jgi:hypothetical protein
MKLGHDVAGGERSLDSTTKSFLDAHKTVTRSLLANGFGDELDPWAAIAAPLPSTTVRALNSSSPAVPKATGSSAPRVREAEHVMNNGAGHGRVQGRSAAPMKLRAQHIQCSAD